MLRRIRSRLTYSDVVASLALFIALGGVSYAAVKLPKNSVGPAQIKKNAVTGSKVRNSSLTGSDVKNSSLTGGDVRNSSLTGGDVKNSSLTGGDVKNSSLTGGDVKDGSLTAKDFSGSVQGPAGAQGPAGTQGPKGDTGATGSPGLNDVEIVERIGTPASFEIRELSADCAAGRKLIGGGGSVNGGTPDVVLRRSFPVEATQSWLVQAIETDPVAGDWNLYAYAICARAG